MQVGHSDGRRPWAPAQQLHAPAETSSWPLGAPLPSAEGWALSTELPESRWDGGWGLEGALPLQCRVAAGPRSRRETGNLHECPPGTSPLSQAPGLCRHSRSADAGVTGTRPAAASRAQGGCGLLPGTDLAPAHCSGARRLPGVCGHVGPELPAALACLSLPTPSIDT